MHEPDLSIIVPALNEAANLPELARRIDAALAGRAYEVLVVDDQSTDDTPTICATLEKQYPFHLHVRPDRHGGLSGAVLYGMARAKGRIFVVMDADLQHPPEKLPELIAAVDGPSAAEFALGSRHVAGGSTAEQWTPFRRLNSFVATLLARPFSGKVTDPMSGFFALPRSVFERARHLQPLGYKIGIELMAKCRVAGVKEIPIHFDTRAHGESKLSAKQQFRYLEHLSRLYDFYFPRLSPAIKFFIASLFGGMVALGIYELLLWRNLEPTIAMSIAYPGVILTTAVFHLRYVRTQREFLLTHSPWRDFIIVAICEWIAATATAQWMHWRIGRVHAVELFAFSFAAAMVVRYIVRKELMQDIRGLKREARAEEFRR